ncbi:MAG TPA: amidase family protein, partial [Gemmatimonadaceae bacterium]|nr:amidase family protein [Gemmatimonadaceae bacterium]
MSVEFTKLGAAAIASNVRAGDVSPPDMVRASFNRAREIGVGRDTLNIYLHSDEKASLEEAEAMHERMGSSADAGVLAGVPVAIKDNIASLGLPTTCASKILAGYVSPFEATAITRMRASGALIVAKTNMDEFAMGSS